MSTSPTILVATDVVSDSNVVRDLLRAEFDHVVTSTKPDLAVADFEHHRPSILILAFKNLEAAERYYLGLYRRSEMIHAVPHRTVILCNKEDLQRVYDLCKKRYFDDYILFWPMTHDTTRLAMAVHHALWRGAETGAGMPTMGQIATQARALLELESHLEEYAVEGRKGIDAAAQLLRQTKQEVKEVADRSTADATAHPSREAGGLNASELDKRIATIVAALNPVSEWADNLKREFEPQLKAASALRTMTKAIRPLVLVVDDDEMQHKLLTHVLTPVGLEIVSARTGMEALNTANKRPPDLVFMDLNMPDIDGIEATRRLRAAERFASVPIVMMTGQSEKDVVVKTRKAGASDFIVKPFDKDTLIAKIRAFLNLGS